MPTIKRKDFVEAFKGRKLDLDRLDGDLKKVAETANEGADRTISTKKELGKLFDSFEDRFDTDGKRGVIQTLAPDSRLSEVGRHYGTLTLQFEGDAAHGVNTKADFFSPEHVFEIQLLGWDEDKLSNEALAEKVKNESCEFLVYKADDLENRLMPGAGKEQNVVFRSNGISLRTSGNFTKGTPKSSYKVQFTDKDCELLGMGTLNFKSMWNDVSQMREAIAWDLFEHAGVHAPRQVYGRVAMNDRYAGLYSIIEQVDKSFLKDHFGKNDDGNLYKAYWMPDDVGAATLEYRQGADGDDSGRQYFKGADLDTRTYQLKTNEKKAEASTYDDLAQFIRTLNGVGLPGAADVRFNSVEYQKAMEDIFDVKGFLRWAATNQLLGAWDNYYLTPSNFYLYNSGKQGANKEFMEKPYFNWIPWDYDNALGVDYFNTKWQYTDLLDFEGSAAKAAGGTPPHLPLITNLLKNDEFKKYYLDALEFMLDTKFNPESIDEMIGVEGSGGLWDRVRGGAFAESDSPGGPAHTGRQWSNDQVYWNGAQSYELNHNGGKIEGLAHYVRMRHDSARAQLSELRKTFPKGSSGETFPPVPTELPPA